MAMALNVSAELGKGEALSVEEKQRQSFDVKASQWQISAEYGNGFASH